MCCTSAYSPCAVSLAWLHGRSSTCGASSRQRSWSSKAARGSLHRGKLPASQSTHPNIHPPWTSFSKQQRVGLRGSNSSFKAVKETKVVLWKNKSPAYLVFWNMKSAVGRNALWDQAGVCHCTSVMHPSHGISLFCLHCFECCSLLNKNLFLQPVEQLCLILSSVEWMCHEWMSFALLLIFTLFAMPSKLHPCCPFIKWRLFEKVVCCYFVEKISNHWTSVLCHLICILVW